MDYLQYQKELTEEIADGILVLNLIINGLPSILLDEIEDIDEFLKF